MKRIKLILKYISSYFPEPIPVGMTTYNKFANEVVDLAGPVADRDSMIYVISSNFLALDPQINSISKQYFVRRLHNAAAKQLASVKFQEIKEAQKQKLAEATATEPKVANGEKTQS